MNLRLTSAFALLAFSACLGAAQPAAAPSTPSAPAAVQAKPEGIRALGGEWIYVEDRTEGQPLERLGPPMASKFSMRVEEAGGGDAVILNGHGSGHRDVRVAIDGSVTGLARLVGRISDGLRGLQTGFARSYALTMLAGTAIVVAAVLLTEMWR